MGDGRWKMEDVHPERGSAATACLPQRGPRVGQETRGMMVDGDGEWVMEDG